jgi:hypothetical protein
VADKLKQAKKSSTTSYQNWSSNIEHLRDYTTNFANSEMISNKSNHIPCDEIVVTLNSIRSQVQENIENITRIEKSLNVKYVSLGTTYKSVKEVSVFITQKPFCMYVRLDNCLIYVCII